MLYLSLFLAAALLTAALTPLAGQLGRRLGLVDLPGGRRQHSGAIPRTGGLALYGGFILVVLSVLWLPHLLPDYGRHLVSAAQRPQRTAPLDRAAGRQHLLRCRRLSR